MSNQEFKPGDRVQFNVGREDGPIGYGIVTYADERGNFRFQPQGAVLPSGAKFFNVKKVG